ncbi:hypothetical protein C8P63_12824 [Melghirimyces profundicolus]|uniref:Uncharacterized protein n=1 Tax=Melghirimyces profundicolus TaxID=1242148 RepID=A0A2T6BC95_9BACL|nr:hypothetical protein [Melghirimyces profundicolus]PTX53662.1 hypothetical protein C8P63_12824 [Melghirimyces profundicolus]
MNLYILIPLAVCILSLVFTVILGKNQERESQKYNRSFTYLALVYSIGISVSALAVALILAFYS